MAPLDDLKELSVFINLPPALHLFRKNPYSFIEFLFTSSESDGLLAKLKNEGLAFTLSMDYDYFAESTRIKITAGLTNLGCKEYRRVLDLTVAYFQCMQIDERDFARLKRVQEEEFRIRQPSEPLDLVEELAANMQMFPVEHVLDYEYIYESFDQVLIKDLVKVIGDYSRWVIVLSDNKGEFDQEEKYYSVKYRIIDEYSGFPGNQAGTDAKELVELGQKNENIPPIQNTAGFSATLSGCGHRPSKQNDLFVFENKWVTDIYLDGMDLVKLGDRFVKTEVFENGRVSYVFDQEFAVPKSKVFILLKNDQIKNAYIHLKLYLSLAEDAFTEKYARQLRNYHLDVEASVIPDGVLVKFEGVSSQAPEMCRCFFNELSNIRPERFALFRKQTENTYTKRVTGAPIKRLNEVFGAAKTSVPSAEQCLDILNTIVFDDISFLGEYQAEVVAVGNIRYSDVLRIYETATHVASSNTAVESSVVVDTTPSLAIEVSFKTTDKFNNALGLFYETADFRRYQQDNDDSTQILKDAAIGRLFHQIGSDDFFHQLRTTEELGYCVISRMHTVKKHEYLTFMVQSEQSVEFLETRIRKFVQDLLENIRTMDTETFQTHKESLIGSYEEPILNLDALGSFIWNQHLNTVIDLGFNKRMVSVIKKLDKADLINSNVFEGYGRVYSYAE